MDIFKDLCRTCGLKRNNLINLFTKDQEEDATLGEKLILLSNSWKIDIDENDELPQYICYYCARQLESAVGFVNKIKLNNEKLRAIVNSAGNQNSSECNITLNTGDDVSGFNVNQNKAEELLLNESYNDEFMEEAVLGEYMVIPEGNLEAIEINSNNSSSSETRVVLLEAIDNKKGIICNGCDKEFFTEKALKLHKKLKHKNVPAIKPNFECDICEKHVNTHEKCTHKVTPEVVMRMKSVEKPFSIESSKTIDLNSISDVEYIPADSDDIKLEKTSLKCHVCNKLFIFKKFLNDHLRKEHSLIYECPIEGCLKLFATKYKVSAHLKRQHNIPFSNTDTRSLVTTLPIDHIKSE